MPLSLKIILLLIFVLFFGYAFIWAFSPQRHAYKFFSKVKQNVDPEELRAWAAKLASSAEPEHIYNVNQLPVPIRGLDQSFESAWSTPATQDNPWTVYLMYGGGFFHYGIAIGPTNFILPSDTNIENTKWVPGIYFRHEGRDL